MPIIGILSIINNRILLIGDYSMKKITFLLIALLIFPLSVYSYSDSIIPGGYTVGISIDTPGIMIVGFYKVDGKYNKGKPELRNGDYIQKINDTSVNTVDELINEINKNKDRKEVEITYKRDNKINKTTLPLIVVDGVYKTGLYVKDNITGTGTISYIDAKTNIYGALGHEVVQSDAKKLVEVKTGNIFENYITSITRSTNGNPGSKNAKFYFDKVYGNILDNTKYGIYGKYNIDLSNTEALPIKKLSDVSLGKAYIRTVTKGKDIDEYEINITKINKSSKLKSISFEVTDERLLNEAGGIVQGMSGSPIIQDGYLIGAVTHVIVDNVKEGYGISIITMLEQGDKYIEE